MIGTREFRLALGFNALFLGIKILLLYSWPYDLFGDEAQYWVWAQQPDWGYYSKPPIVAWAIYATTHLFGDTTFAIRLASPLFHFLTALVIYFIGRELGKLKLGLWASITYTTLPAVTVSSTLISTDPPLLFFWSLALLFFVRAIHENRTRDWVLSGVAAGCGMLSKYSMAFFLFSALMFPRHAKKYGEMYTSGKFWLAVFVAFLVYLPNLIWNLDHGFVSYLHTQDNANLGAFGVNFDKFLEFLGGQFLVFGPILFFFLLRHIYRTSRALAYPISPDIALLFSFVQPMLLFMLLLSLFTRAHMNWAAPIYIAGSLWVCHWFLQERRMFWLKLSLVLHLFVAGAYYSYDFLLDKTGIKIEKNIDPFRRLRGWQQTADEIRAYKEAYPEVAILVDNRLLAAEMMYYLRDAEEKPAVIYKWDGVQGISDHFELTQDIHNLEGKDMLFISHPDNNPADKYAGHFTLFEKIGDIEIPVYEGQPRIYSVHYLHRFRAEK